MRLFVLAAMALMAGAQALPAQPVLTDTDVVRMVQAGVAQDLILKMIAQSPPQFAVAPDHLIAWKQAGVPDVVARAMVAREREAPRLQYTHFSSEVRAVPAQRRHRRLTRLYIR